MLSVVILNWMRFENVIRILQHLETCNIVAEILVVNSNPDVCFPPYEKLTVVQTTRDLGLDARFAIAAMAKTDQVLIQDDDLLLPPDTIAALSEAGRREPMRLHGLFGRNPRPDNTYAAFFEQTAAEVDIVLTRALVAWQSQIGAFFHARSQSQIVAARSRYRQFETNPHNGEDIIFSYAVTAVTGERHRVHEFPVEELPALDVGISSDTDRHYRFRTEIMRAAQTLRPL